MNGLRGQYGQGWVGGKKMSGYREEDGASPDSQTETFVALRLFLDNWRWQERADKNIDELLEDLNGTFHRLRQSGIDEELFDVISGFEALSVKEK